MISPQGYNLGEEPKAKNPFWDGSGEDSDVNRIYATATVDENVGTPSVQTTKSIDGHGITFGFNFHNLKGRDGTDGRDGTNGTNGTDGVSPTITVTDITGGHRVSITDATGTHSFNVMNGQNGRDGRDGTNGTDGRDGTDGVSPSVSVSDITGGHRITVTDATGSETFDVMNGADGRDGTNGTNGQDGVSPTVMVTDITGGHQVSITDAQGTSSFNVMNGTDGQDGQNGTNGQDGVTPDITMSATADATSSANPTVTVTKGGTTANPTFALAFSGLKGAQGAPGQDAEWPSGGSAGDILTKTASGVAWETPSGGGGGGLELVLTVPAQTLNIASLFADLANVLNDGDRVCIECVDSLGRTVPFKWEANGSSSFYTREAKLDSSYSYVSGSEQYASIPIMKPYLFNKDASSQSLTALSPSIETNIAYPPIFRMWRVISTGVCTCDTGGAYVKTLSTGFSIIYSTDRQTLASSRSSNEIRVYKIGVS